MRRFVIAAGMLLLAGETALAAVTPNSAILPQTPNRGHVTFVQGTDNPGTFKNIYTGGVNGSKCIALWTTNNDASATHALTIDVSSASVSYGGVVLTTVESAGYVSGTPPQNLMSSAVWPGLPVDSTSNPYFFLAPTDTLRATFASALSSNAVINVTAICSDY